MIVTIEKVIESLYRRKEECIGDLMMMERFFVLPKSAIYLDGLF